MRQATTLYQFRPRANLRHLTPSPLSRLRHPKIKILTIRWLAWSKPWCKCHRGLTNSYQLKKTLRKNFRKSTCKTPSFVWSTRSSSRSWLQARRETNFMKSWLLSWCSSSRKRGFPPILNYKKIIIQFLSSRKRMHWIMCFLMQTWANRSLRRTLQTIIETRSMSYSISVLSPTSSRSTSWMSKINWIILNYKNSLTIVRLSKKKRMKTKILEI